MSNEGDKMQVGLEGRLNAFHSVRGRLGAVSGTLREFGIPTGLEKDATTSKLVDHLRESNDPRRAPAFSLEEALPKLFHALFTLNTFPTWSKKVRVWARSLVTIDLTARSSDVTYYCPKLENMNSLMTQWILHLMACPTFYRLALMTGRVGPHEQAEQSNTPLFVKNETFVFGGRTNTANPE